MAPWESAEGEHDNREQEQETERETSDCKQAIRVHSVGEHRFPPFMPEMGGPAAAAAISPRTGRGPCQVADRAAGSP